MVLKTIGEGELEITLAPFGGVVGNTASNPYVIQTFPQNTLITTTFYIDNSQNLPQGSNGTVTITIVDWTNGQLSTMTLNAYRYGQFIQSYPIQIISAVNNFNITIQLYVQYVIQTYEDNISPIIQDITQQIQTAELITEALTPGTNFRYNGSLASLSLAGLPLGSTFYVLDQQVVGTSSSSTGYVLVPWTATFPVQLDVSALGVNERMLTYVFTVDTTSQAVSGNATSSNAIMNWVELDFFSPLEETITEGSTSIIYNSTLKQFECDDIIIDTYYAQYITNVPAPLTVVMNTLI